MQVASFCSSAPCEYDLGMQTKSTKTRCQCRRFNQNRFVRPLLAYYALELNVITYLYWLSLTDCRSVLTVIALKHNA